MYSKINSYIDCPSALFVIPAKAGIAVYACHTGEGRYPEVLIKTGSRIKAFRDDKPTSETGSFAGMTIKRWDDI